MTFNVEIVGLTFSLIGQKLSIMVMKPSDDVDAKYRILPVVSLVRGIPPEDQLSIYIGSLGVRVSYIEQLYTFADERESVIKMAYIVITESTEPTKPAAHRTIDWFSAKRSPRLLESHLKVKELGIQRLRNKISYSRIATRFLPEEFTLSQLMAVYEEILDEPIDKRNFRKKIESKKIVVPTDKYLRGVHRPARLYRQGPKAKNVLL